MLLATLVEPHERIKPKVKHYYTMWKTSLDIDMKYSLMEQICRGSYGVVFSAINKETNDKVAMKKISNVFDNLIDSL